jgi:hypothetical protein
VRGEGQVVKVQISRRQGLSRVMRFSGDAWMIAVESRDVSESDGNECLLVVFVWVLA